MSITRKLSLGATCERLGKSGDSVVCDPPPRGVYGKRLRARDILAFLITLRVKYFFVIEFYMNFQFDY